MKAIIKTLVFLNLIITTTIWGQESLKLQDLKTPTTPGFQILDIAPSLIERPTNPKEFAATLMSLTSNGTVIPKNFAMEFSPFWTMDNKTTINSYLDLGDKKEQGKSGKYYIKSGFFKKMSLSLVSVYSDSTSGSLLKKTNYIAFGVRTNLLTIRTKEQSDDILATIDAYKTRVRELKSNKDEVENLYFLEQSNLKLRNIKQREITALQQQELTADISLKIENLHAEVDQIEVLLTTIESKQLVYAQESINELDKKMESDPKIKEYYEKIKQLPFIQVDGAYAYSDALANNQSDNRRFNRYGIWLNGALNFSGPNNKKSDNITLMLCARYVNDNVLNDTIANTFKRQNVFDWGFKLEYSLDNLSISVEHLKRDYSDNSDLNSDRTIGVLQYKISDGVYFTGSYGKNFGNVNNLFTLFGLNYGFGTSKLKTDDD